MANLQPMNRAGKQWQDSPPPEGWEEVSGPPTGAPVKPVSEQEATAARMPSWEDITQSLMPGHPTLAKAAGYVGDVFQGAGTEAASQLGRLTSYVSPKGGAALQPIINRYTPRVDVPGEGLGRVALDTAEFLLPGSGEAKSGEALREATSALPKIVSEGARFLPSIASAGGVSALQGGSFTGGALAGAGFGAAGRAGEAIAPRLMEKAIGVTPRQLRYGATPGEEVLSEPSGATPQRVSAWAAAKARPYSQLLHQMLSDATQNGVTVDLRPARGLLDREIENATARSSKPVLNRLKQLREQLETLPDGTPIQPTVSPIQAADLKRGVSETVGAWEKESEGVPGRVKGVGRRVYREIDKATDASVPGHKEVNDKLASLLTAAKPKGRPQGVFGRGVAGTSAGRVALPALGYFEARERGYSPLQAGALAAGLEGLNSPTVAIGAARALNSPTTAPLLRGLTLGTYHGMTPSLRPDSILPSMSPSFRAPEDPNRMPKPLERGGRRVFPNTRLGDL
jgi:hypothetical protein